MAVSVILAVVESLKMIIKGSCPGSGGWYSIPSIQMVIFDMGNPVKLAPCVGVGLFGTPVTVMLSLPLLWLESRVTDEVAEVKLLEADVVRLIAEAPEDSPVRHY